MTAKKAIGIAPKTTTYHVQHAFCDFYAVICTARLQRDEVSRFLEDMSTSQQFSFSEFRYTPSHMLSSLFTIQQPLAKKMKFTRVRK